MIAHPHDSGRGALEVDGGRSCVFKWFRQIPRVCAASRSRRDMVGSRAFHTFEYVCFVGTSSSRMANAASLRSASVLNL